jgi:hypothetical protein
VKYPVLDAALVLMDSASSDNASGAGNQQERLSIATIASDLGNFLAGFALGEGSFMIICRRRADYRCGWKVSAAFNVSQNDIAPLELFRKTLGCGTIRIAGNNGWYFEVNNLGDIQTAVVPFFRRFPLVGRKQTDFELFADAVSILAQSPLSDTACREILKIRESLNGGGKRRYTMERILRDYTPNPSR